LEDIAEGQTKEFKWSKGPDGKPKKGEPTGNMKPIFVFKFIHADEELGNAKAQLRTNSDTTKALVKILKQLCPSQITEAVEGDPEKLMIIANSLIGKAFSISTQSSESYNNIMTVGPIPKGIKVDPMPTAQQEVRQVVMEEEKSDYDDDSIPF
jgi:hypothetical protein